MSQFIDATRWPMLPGPKWQTADEARRWLKRERQRLSWSEKDVEKAFSDCAFHSDLYIGPGGGSLFDRATVAQVRRFEGGGEVIPDWMFWMPLAIARVEYSRTPDAQDLGWALWDEENIPSHRESREDVEENDYHSRTTYLNDDEFELLRRYRDMTGKQTAVLLHLARHVDYLEAIGAHLIRA